MSITNQVNVGPSCMDQPSGEHRIQLWDTRSNKVSGKLLEFSKSSGLFCGQLDLQSNLDPPDFKPHTRKEARLIDHGRTSQWETAFRTICVGSFQGGNNSIGAAKAEKSVHKDLNKVKETSIHIAEHLNDLPLFKMNHLMHTYVKHGNMVDACQVFDNMPKRDVVTFNIMILGYAKQERGMLALELYARMHHGGVQPSALTFIAALKACNSLAAVEQGNQFDRKLVKLACLDKGRAIHSLLVKSGFESHISVGTTLVDMYTKCGSMEDARGVFDELPKRDVISWNAMILGYSRQEEGMLALDLYSQMLQEGVTPDRRTFVSTLKACSSLAAMEEGQQADATFIKLGCLEKSRAIHSQILNSGFESDIFVATTLVNLYSKCASMEDARYVFNGLPHRDVISWNALILGYSKQEEGMLALDLYAWMQHEGVKPDDRTFVGILKSCGSLAALEEGKQADGKFVKTGGMQIGRAIHSQAVKSGFDSDVYVGNTLVDMYAKSGSVEDARCVFDYLPHRTVVSWNAMIMGYNNGEDGARALDLYVRMQQEGVRPCSRTFVGALKACGNITALQTGKKLHFEISKLGLDTVTIVANSLIDMYAKCGSVVNARYLFDALPTRDVVTWSSLIAGYAHQGESQIVFHLFERMKREGVQPDGVAFLSVLTVCSHVGLVHKAQRYFQDMSKKCGIVPTMEHYSCMIDLLGRAGQLHKAMMMVKEMPFQSNVVVWLSVLGACRKWNNVELGRYAFENAVRLDKKHPAAYVLMANIYADAHMQQDGDKILVMRKNAQAWKKLGHSWWTDLRGIVHTFVVGNKEHPQINDINAKLKDLSLKMQEEGYVPNFNDASQNIHDDETEDASCGHSEKLAIACALINTPETTPIFIRKDLWVCVDCHRATALISKVEKRNVICRDASRIHNFKDGKCSCGEYL